ncbi:MAG TPA: ABC transporter ATP-binding protein [Verrucomicrobiales bacterium]|jgi:ABC-type lipoprotein export system ATPase subunit|nr:ABC transporter ATP-binding protein [Verrucomicrobiales bacterium]HIL71376.1 ABC transporter ATP-binding protein [Verrucomicrobiota bacterium]
MDSSDIIIQAKQLVRKYGDRRILAGIDIKVHRGERVALMGPSGAGKSTLLNCIGGIDQPDEGQVFLGGVELSSLGTDQLAKIRREQISHIFQFFHLLPTLTVTENIEFPMLLNEVPERERKKRVSLLLKEVGLESRRDALPDELSGGEMQRVAVARALGVEPCVILADEPTGNLDSRTGQLVLELIKETTESRNIALILVTHSETATRICHRIVHIEDGRLKS